MQTTNSGVHQCDRCCCLCVSQALVQVTLTVDNQYTERWTSPGSFNLLSSARVYVGGAPRELQVNFNDLLGLAVHNLVSLKFDVKT